MTAVRTQSIGPVLLITIDNPPINATSHAVRAGLVAAVDELSGRGDLTSAVLIGAGNTFIAGADIREFGQPARDPSLPAVIEAIEACPKPVVAAMHGAALGGGLEVALACDARIALKGTSPGLPEVTLGVVPGAGGTQRLPRRAGLVRAIELIGRGERIDAAEGLRLLDASSTTSMSPARWATPSARSSAASLANASSARRPISSAVKVRRVMPRSTEAVQGYGFPRWQGGPVFWAQRQDRGSLQAELRQLGETAGFGFVAADPAPFFTA